MRSGPLMPMRMLHAGWAPSGGPNASSRMGKWVETGELGAGVGVCAVAGVVAGFFDWDCEDAGVDFVCAAIWLAPLYAPAVMASAKIANPLENSGTVRKIFLRGSHGSYRNVRCNCRTSRRSAVRVWMNSLR